MLLKFQQSHIISNKNNMKKKHEIRRQKFNDLSQKFRFQKKYLSNEIYLKSKII